MKLGIIIQARMSSERFPGKALYRLMGKPMLQYLVEKLEHCTLCDSIVVATSCESSDKPIRRFCEECGISCFEGSLEDVAGRFRAAAACYGFEAFVRVSGDSPLLDPVIVDRAIEVFLAGSFDLVTNVQERSFPKGQSVEVIRKSSFDAAYAGMLNHGDLEHVTRHFYSHPNFYAIHNIHSGKAYGGIQLSVDTPDDMTLVERILAQMRRPHWEYGIEDVLWLRERVLAEQRN